MQVGLGPFHLKWVARMHDYREGVSFEDTQLSGPFAYWHHTHTFHPAENSQCMLEDRIEYRLPLGLPGQWVAAGLVRAKLAEMFAYRHRVTMNDIALHQKYKGDTAMKIAVTGATGLLGSTLCAFLSAGGHHVIRFSRHKPEAGNTYVDPDLIYWDPDKGNIEKFKLEGVDAVVHLAGENIAEGRWDNAKKDRIMQSRLKGTRILCEALAGLEHPPKVLVSASAIGYYGSRGDELMTEKSAAGKDFLANVCRNWESATEAARHKGIRVVNLRIGVVLSPKGGALEKMLLPFQLGLGGMLGNGRQYMSWVSLDDVVGGIYHAINTESLEGPVNMVAPNPVTNKEFTRVLAKVLVRPALAPVPALALKLLLGEMADALLLSSTRVDPRQLKNSGYQFLYPDLEGALRHQLGKTGAAAEAKHEKAPH